MRKPILFAALLFLVAAVQIFHGQDATVPQRTLELSAAYQPFTLTSAVTSQIFNVTGMDSHAVTYTFPANITGVTVTVSASTDNTNYATQGTSTSGAGTISFSGTFALVKVSESGMTSAMAPMAGVYNGTLLAGHAALFAGLNSTTAVPVAVDSSGNVMVKPASSASEVVHPIPSGFTVQAVLTTSGLFAITSGSTGTATSTTTFVDAFPCVNTSASSVNLTVMDGNGKYALGPNFVMPGLSQLPSAALRGTFTSGIQTSASAAGINCSIYGWQ